MKKFDNVGYRPYREDSGRTGSGNYGTLGFEFLLFGGDEEERPYGDGDELVSLTWGTQLEYRRKGQVDSPFWYSASWSFGSMSRYPSGDAIENAKLGINVAKYVEKWFGFYVPENVAMVLPDNIAEVAAILKKERESYYDGYTRGLDPHVLVYLGLPALNIPRVVNDFRVHRVIKVDDMLDTEVCEWIARSYYDLHDRDGTFMCSVLAPNQEEALEIAKVEVKGEVAALTATDFRGRSTPRPKWTLPQDKDKYLEAAKKWFEMPSVYRMPGPRAPEVTPIEQLLDASARYEGHRL